jgi:hypothetical protein
VKQFTKMSSLQTFRIEGAQRWLLLASPWILFLFMCFSISLPFISDEQPRNEAFILWFSVISTIFLGVGLWYAAYVVRNLHLTEFTVDDEGLWPTVFPRSSSLVPWARINGVRERPRLQRLELLDAAGTVLARLEYELNGFDHLRAIVLTRANLHQTLGNPHGNAYGVSIWHHVLNIGSLVGFNLLGLYVGESQPLIGYGGMALIVALVGWDYWKSPYNLFLSEEGLEIVRPFRKRFIARDRITKIDLADEFVNYRRNPYVVVSLREPERPIHLKHFQLSAVELVRVLKAWHEGRA